MEERVLWSRRCENFAEKLRCAGERRAFQLPGRGTQTGSFWLWLSSSSRMPRSASGNFKPTGRVGSSIRGRPHFNDSGAAGSGDPCRAAARERATYRMNCAEADRDAVPGVYCPDRNNELDQFPFGKLAARFVVPVIRHTGLRHQCHCLGPGQRGPRARLPPPPKGSESRKGDPRPNRRHDPRAESRIRILGNFQFARGSAVASA
jgi:hypothetical protein